MEQSIFVAGGRRFATTTCGASGRSRDTATGTPTRPPRCVTSFANRFRGVAGSEKYTGYSDASEHLTVLFWVVLLAEYWAKKYDALTLHN